MTAPLHGEIRYQTQPGEPTNTTVIVPVAGAFNLGKDSLSSAALHFARLRSSLAKRLERPVEHPIIPEYLGMLSIHGAYRHFEQNVTEILEKRGSGSRPYFVAHSLGGELALRYALEHTDTAGVLTIGTPHTTMQHTILDPLHIRTGTIGRFAQETVEGILQQGGPEAMTFIGSSVDRSVPWEYTLPDIDQAGRFGFSHTGRLPSELAGAMPIRTSKINHAGLIHHHEAVEFIVESVASNLAFQEAAARFSAPAGATA